jgi:colanic acid/amylovoran biosynthesis glycosyltransferase
MAEINKLHILVVGISWPPETFLVRLIDGLLEKNIEITVATKYPPEKVWQEKKGFHWILTPKWEGSIYYRFFCIFKLLLKLFAVDKESFQEINREIFSTRKSISSYLLQLFHLLPFATSKWDVLYFPWNSAAISYYPLFDLGTPTVVSCRGSQVNIAPHNPKRKFILAGLKKTFEKVNGIHCVSKNIQITAMNYGLDENKSEIIYPAVDPNYFLPGETKKGAREEYKILSTGSLIWRKGYEYALSAIREIKELGVPVNYEIIGIGPNEQQIRFAIHDLGLENEVKLLGRLDPQAVRNRLQSADVFLLTSLSEGVSNAVLEAMSCNLPVITTDCGGMTEAVSHLVEGLVVPTYDANAIADALAMLWKQPELREKMGFLAREKIKKEFDIAQQIDAFVHLFFKVSREKRYFSSESKND